jgi:PAS domain-containing protein
MTGNRGDYEEHEGREGFLRGTRGALFLLFALFASFVVPPLSARAEEPFFKKGDVIALVGGEDMVAASEYGYLELLLTRALPDHHLKFRCLAWEGDTVFEQRRDLNFPSWEEQLEKIGATVVICQFGQMESLAGEGKLPEFVAAYEKMIERLQGGGNRRVVLLRPRLFEINKYPDDYYSPRTFLFRTGASDSVRDALKEPLENEEAYIEAIRQLAARRQLRCISFRSTTLLINFPAAVEVTRDGVHGSDEGHRRMATDSAAALLGLKEDEKGRAPKEFVLPRDEGSYAIIRAKNRLWFDYWRPQNWAFLAGDRTEQPSSRDHLDRTKRWFPEERERFLPLIEKKEQEIWDLAAKLAKP